MKSKAGLIPPKLAISILGSFVAIAVTVCCFLTSCNSKDDLLELSSADAGTLTSESLKCGRVFTVSPSGNYNDDSYKIQTALDAAVVAGHGSTVQLTKGTFYLKDRIEVEGFDGFFKGAGKDKTIITTHYPVNFNLPTTEMESLIKFRHGNINLADMLIKITEPNPCTGLNSNDWWQNAFPCVIMITGSNDENPGPADQPAKFTFNNVKFVGGPGNFYGYNLCYFINVFWEGSTMYFLNGGYKITNCEFQKGYTCIQTVCTGGPCIIGGDETSGNKFEEAEVGAGAFDVKTSYSNISYNHFDKIHWMAIANGQGVIANPYFLPLTKFIVYANDIKLNSYTPGNEAFTIGINPVDYGIFAGTSTEPKIEAVVSNNKIQINDIGFAGILGQCCNNAKITNNKIWGSGTAGIVSGIWDDPVSGWLLKGNDVHGINAQVAPIWLGAATSKFLVYADKNDVLDEGTDNILLGEHNRRSGHPGPQFKEKMMKQYEMMKNHKQPGMK